MRESDCYGDEVREIGPLFAAAAAGPFDGSRVEPTLLQRRVAGLIWRHKGHRNPISIAEISQVTGLSDRLVKSVVESLVMLHGMKIGARRENPRGYFVIETIEDQEIGVKPYKRQALRMIERVRKLDSPRGIREFLGQLRISEGEGNGSTD